MFDAREDTVDAIAAALTLSRSALYRNIDTRPPEDRVDGAESAA
jgi:hypothetical protein